MAAASAARFPIKRRVVQVAAVEQLHGDFYCWTRIRLWFASCMVCMCLIGSQD